MQMKAGVPGQPRLDFGMLVCRVVIQNEMQVTISGSSREIDLTFVPGGRRVNVGRGTDNDLYLNHTSVSKVHAAVRMDNLGTLLVADTGSTNGTHINGVRIPYGEARPIEEGDVVAFGEVEVRFRRLNS